MHMPMHELYANSVLIRVIRLSPARWRHLGCRVRNSDDFTISKMISRFQVIEEKNSKNLEVLVRIISILHLLKFRELYQDNNRICLFESKNISIGEISVLKMETFIPKSFNLSKKKSRSPTDNLQLN